MPYPLAAIRYKSGGGPRASSLLSGLTHYWKLDEVSGSRLDTVGILNMSVGGTVGYEPGLLGNAATFAGASNRLEYTGQLSIPSTGVTIWGWVKFAATTGRCPILGHGVSSINWSLRKETTNDWRLEIKDNDNTNYTTAVNTATTTVDVWHFVCGRYNSSTKKGELRIDSSSWVLASSALPTYPKIITTESLYINRYGASYGTDSIDSIGFAERYFTDSEVSQLYNGGAGLEYPFNGVGGADPTEPYYGPDWYVEP